MPFVAQLGNGAPDLLVHSRRDNRLYLIEVKTLKGKLRDKQEVFADFWPVHVLRSVEEAIEFMRTH